MPRILTGGFDDDPVYTDVAGEDIEKAAILDPDPERHVQTHCPRCGKPLEAARLTCHACGDQDDEEQAAA